MLNKAKLNKEVGVFEAHKTKIIFCSLWIFFIILSFIFYNVIKKNEEQKNSELSKLQGSISSIEMEVNFLSENEKNKESILKKMSEIPIEKKFVKGFKDEYFDKLISFFEKNSGIKLQVTKNKNQCSSDISSISVDEKISNCLTLLISFDGNVSEERPLQLYKYLNSSLPGYVIPMEIVVKRNIDDSNSGKKYKSSMKFYWIYFSSDD